MLELEEPGRQEGLLSSEGEQTSLVTVSVCLSGATLLEMKDGC